MTISQTSICQKALHFIGIGEEIASINERSPEAEACLQFYDEALDELLREFPWPFATRNVALSTTNATDPDDDDALIEYSDEFFYSFRYPSDCVYARRIMSGQVPDDSSSIIRYKIASDTTGRLILANVETATLEYTSRVTDAALYPSDFAMALSYRLAAYIAPRLAEDPAKASQVAMRGYAFSLAKARSVAASEESEGPPPKSSFERAR